MTLQLSIVDVVIIELYDYKNFLSINLYSFLAYDKNKNNLQYPQMTFRIEGLNTLLIMLFNHIFKKCYVKKMSYCDTQTMDSVNLEKNKALIVEKNVQSSSIVPDSLLWFVFEWQMNFVQRMFALFFQDKKHNISKAFTNTYFTKWNSLQFKLLTFHAGTRSARQQLKKTLQ
ncbi:hypothetical protein RFI_38454 [Reticulomyxa filosa]|uniref:Uncharacterized protein n=1 Tax=Reticulomyxa filosa TaxID=46433 RepID=X6LCE9_RETFI|nr:hypothetical protein RFI_38454 [Reticulomyxa filosa]|eukprot:ETN99030.1 hypothetical protein RFI_38454 [Reticulomyxa filosa]